jgi:hypothetical protein
MRIPYKWLHHPRTTQEKRRNCYEKEFCRAKRRPANLVDAYDDFFIIVPRSWKRLCRRHQWERSS